MTHPLQIDLYDDSPTGTPGNKKNWVDKAGGLPGPIRARYRAIKRKHPEWTREHCYAVAVNAVKYSAATGDSKLPGKQNQRASKVAAHRGAATRWEAMKARKGVHLSENDVGTKSSGITDSKKLSAAMAKYKKNKKKYTPQQQAKIEAQFKSSKQRLSGKAGNMSFSESTTVGKDTQKKGTNVASDGSKSKEFNSSEFHAAHENQKCSRWQHGDNPPKAVKCRQVGGRHLGACAEHAKQMTKGADLSDTNTSNGKADGPKGTDSNKHDLVFFSKRSTPKVVPKGASVGNVPEGYGAQTSRRAATAEEEKQISKGDWVRVDSSGNKPSDSNYKKTKYRPQLVNNSEPAVDITTAVDLAVKGGTRAYTESQVQRGAGGRFGNKGGVAAAGASNNSATSEGNPQDFPSLVKNLKPGQSVTLPNTKAVKIKKVANGYQVFDGKNNKLVRTPEDAISTAQAMARKVPSSDNN